MPRDDFSINYARVQGRYTTDHERVRDYFLLGIDVHMLYYFCVYLTLAYFLREFLQDNPQRHQGQPHERQLLEVMR